jgi:hypothetical protein
MKVDYMLQQLVINYYTKGQFISTISQEIMVI